MRGKELRFVHPRSPYVWRFLSTVAPAACICSFTRLYRQESVIPFLFPVVCARSWPRPASHSSLHCTPSTSHVKLIISTTNNCVSTVTARWFQHVQSLNLPHFVTYNLDIINTVLAEAEVSKPLISRLNLIMLQLQSSRYTSLNKPQINPLSSFSAPPSNPSQIIPSSSFSAPPSNPFHINPSYCFSAPSSNPIQIIFSSPFSVLQLKDFYEAS
jgi:hypothetical protein